jgi:hypothetical protein
MPVGECDAKGYDLRTRRQGLRSSCDAGLASPAPFHAASPRDSAEWLKASRSRPIWAASIRPAAIPVAARVISGSTPSHRGQRSREPSGSSAAAVTFSAPQRSHLTDDGKAWPIRDSAPAEIAAFIPISVSVIRLAIFERRLTALCFEAVKSSYGNHALRLGASEREEVSSRPFLFGSATERTQPGTRLASVTEKGEGKLPDATRHAKPRPVARGRDGRRLNANRQFNEPSF